MSGRPGRRPGPPGGRSGKPRPPGAATWLLRRLLPSEDRTSFPDELAELYRRRVDVRGALRADLWYWAQVTEMALRLVVTGRRRVDRRLRGVRTAGEVRPPASWTARLLDGTTRDLKTAVRGLARRPAFTMIAVVSLALGIGANTAIFSVVNAVLLRPLPVDAPETLVEVYTSDSSGAPYATFSYPDLADLRAEGGEVFEGVAGYQLFFATSDRNEAPELVMGEAVTANYFDLLGVDPVIGRGFTEEEDRTPGAHPVVVLGHDYWTERFGGSDALGRTVRVNRVPYTVVGVAPEGFAGLTPGLVPDLWVPMTMIDQVVPMDGTRLEARGSRSAFVKARLRPEVSVAEAQTFLDAFSRRLGEEYPDTNEGRTMSALRSSDVSVHPTVDSAVVPVAGFLLTVVGLVLVITCANLAGYLLARAEERSSDVAVRLALGSGRWGVGRYFFVETLVLAALGGVGGIWVARLLVDLLLGFQPPIPVPLNLDVRLDRRVLLFTMGITLFAAIAFGMTPALRAARHDVGSALRTGGHGGGGVRGSKLRRALVVGQVALSCVLMVGAGLFLRSLYRARTVDPGFYTGSAAIVWPNLRLSGIPDEEGVAIWDDLVERVGAHPAVDGVALADALPLGIGVQTIAVEIPGATADAADDRIAVDHTTVSPSFFDVMDVDLLRGRVFERTRPGGWDGSIIVSRAFEERYFPEGAVGETLNPSGERPLSIVGVAEDTKVRTLGEPPRPRIYFPLGWTYIEGLQMVARGSAPSGELLAAVQGSIRGAYPDLVLFEAKTMEAHLGVMLFPPRMGALLLSAFGVLALLLAAIGLYGIVSYAVARRTHEMGIRLSLGATPSAVSRLVIRGGLAMVLVGGAVGMALSLALGSVVSSLLIGVGERDVVALLAAPALLLAVGLLAAGIPALRATRLDPAEVLRAD